MGATGARCGVAENRGCPGGIPTQRENQLSAHPPPQHHLTLIWQPPYCSGIRSFELNLYLFPWKQASY